MNRRWKIGGLILVAGLIILQFFQPERNLGPENEQNDMLQVLEVPDSLAILIRTSCYNCHSDATKYPWYSRISPVSWYLDKHIRTGKESLNFSEFGQLENARKVSKLTDICEEVESGAMPLKSYLIIHGDARLDPGEREALCDWSESASLGILRAGKH